jgi:hypothetical protein
VKALPRIPERLAVSVQNGSAKAVAAFSSNVATVSVNHRGDICWRNIEVLE